MEQNTLSIAERQIPGNANKWFALRHIRDAWPQAVNSRQLVGLYGWDGPPPAVGRRTPGGQWQLTLSHVGQDLRFLRAGGWIRSVGRQREGWGKGNPDQYVITQEGRDKLDSLDRDKAAWASRETRDARIQVARETRAADIARLDKISQAMMSLYPDGADMWERRKAAAWMREQGCSLRRIGAVFQVSAETIRTDLLYGPGESEGAA